MIADAWLKQAIDEIYSTYGHRVKIGRKTLRKYGINPDVDTSEADVNYIDVDEVYLDENLITHAVSSSGSDTGSLYIEGMVLVGGDLKFSVQTITLTGQTKAALTTPLARCTRARYLGATANAGDIYVMEDEAITSGVPSDLTTAHAMVPAGEAATLQAMTSVAANNYFIMTYWRATVGKKTTAVADVRLRTRVLGNGFITQGFKSVGSSGQLSISDPPYRIIEPNSDIKVTAAASATNVEVAASYGGIFADIITDDEWRGLQEEWGGV